MEVLTEIGLRVDAATTGRFEGRPAVFLDRDGVLVEEVHFLRRAGDVVLTADIGNAITRANAGKIPVIVITNQSGIARGLFGWDEFTEVQTRVAELLAAAGARIDLTLACGYHPSGNGELARDHPWRKPRPGMFHQAASQFGVDLTRSLVVGDRVTDLEAGEAAGLRDGILALTGYGAGEAVDKLPTKAAGWRASFRTSVAPNAALAIANWLDREAWRAN